MSIPDGSPAPGAPPEVLLGWLHDLRNPLAALVTNLHHLHGGARAPADDGAEVLAECLALCDMLERYVGNLEVLVHQRRARGRPAVDLGDIAEDVARRLSPQAALTGHTVAVSHRADAVVNAEGAALRLALENLVANAFEQSAGGEVLLVVDADATRGHVRILDDGPPWTPEDAERVFSLACASAPARGRAQIGWGLGLASASFAARVAGGSLELAPAAEGRLCVRVLGPLASARGA